MYSIAFKKYNVLGLSTHVRFVLVGCFNSIVSSKQETNLSGATATRALRFPNINYPHFWAPVILHVRGCVVCISRMGTQSLDLYNVECSMPMHLWPIGFGLHDQSVLFSHCGPNRNTLTMNILTCSYRPRFHHHRYHNYINLHDQTYT